MRVYEVYESFVPFCLKYFLKPSVHLNSCWQFQRYEKLIVSLRTAQAKEYSLDKKQTSYDDLLDALRLSLKGYNIK
jgi:hypothetical protein